MIDIICFTEHWQSETEAELFLINGFFRISNYSRSCIKNGGACIYARHTILNNCKNRMDICILSKERSFECSAIELTLTNTMNKLVILSVYRPPSGNFEIFIETLDEVLDKINKEKKYVLLCGDLNIDDLLNTPQKNIFNALLTTHNLNKCTKGPTRITKNTVSSIDYIITNLQNQYLGKILTTGLSDHEGQEITIYNTLPMESSNIDVKSLTRTQNSEIWNNIVSKLLMESWEDVYRCLNNNRDIDKNFNSFQGTFLSYIDKYAPVKEVIHKPKSKTWFTTGLKISCEKMKLLYKIKKSSNNLAFLEYFKKYKNIYKKTLIQAKKLYLDDYIINSEDKIRATWKVINSNMKNEIPPNDIQINVHGNKYRGVDAANIINKYFTNLSNTLFPESYIHIASVNNNDHNFFMKKAFIESKNSIFARPITEIEILEIINQMKNTNTYDIYYISNAIIKKCAIAIAKPLMFIFNKCLENGIFPKLLKLARVKPVFKKGDKENVENYRPISVLPIISKILERAMSNRICNYCEQYQILVPEQYGFVKGKNIDNATYEFTQHILMALDSKLKVIGIYADLSKAFDLVNHAILLSKLEYYGIRGNMLKLMTSYLNDREQLVLLRDNKMKQCCSNWEKIYCGVPQGSILGPLLFILFVNDLPKCLPDFKMILYADDTTIVVQDKDIEQLENKSNYVINFLWEWFQANKLIINQSKTNFTRFSCKEIVEDDKLNIELNGDNIQEKKCSKFLGLQIDCNLNWKEHIDTMQKKLSSICYALRSLRNLVNKKSLIIVYFAYFHSIINYGIIHWGNSIDINQIFIIQKYAIRIIANKSRRTTCRPLFKDLGIMPLATAYLFQIIKFVNKNNHLFNENCSMHDHFTRNNMMLRVDKHTLSKYEKGIHYSGIKLFNALPKRIRTAPTTLRFNKVLKNFFLDNPFYSVDEYLRYK